MAKKRLNDRFIESLKTRGARQDFHDAIVPGLALRITERGHKSFILIARFPLQGDGTPNAENYPTRRALGDCGALTLAGARDKARVWLELLDKGIDPKVEEMRQKALEVRRQANSFATVADQFLERHVKGPAYVELERLATEHKKKNAPAVTDEQAFAAVCAAAENKQLVVKSKRQGIAKKKDAERVIQEFMRSWGPRPVGDILPEEVAGAIRGIVKRGAPAQAHNALGYLSRMYSWAIGTREFGIASSPTERLRPKDLIGERVVRARVLSDDELRAVWNAADSLGYPYGPLVRLLILTGQRLREVADATWSEFNLSEKLWTIPAERMKGDRAHEVPLSEAVVAILEKLPRFRGPHVFSTTAGEKPVNGFSRAKSRCDKLSGIDDWVLHDLRRTARTHFSALPVQDLVRELVIAHAKPGLHKVYDRHAYRNEKRECLDLWAARLQVIVAPKPEPESAVIDIRNHRRRDA